MVLMTLRVSGALFISMIVTGIIAFFTGQLKFADKIVAMPHLPRVSSFQTQSMPFQM